MFPFLQKPLSSCKTDLVNLDYGIIMRTICLEYWGEKVVNLSGHIQDMRHTIRVQLLQK